MTEDIKKEEVKEEEATGTTEEVVEEVSEPSELEEAQARAEEFENKYLEGNELNWEMDSLNTFISGDSVTNNTCKASGYQA